MPPRMLVATDLDGTLVPSGSAELRAYTASVLRRLDDAGVPVVFVTARPLRWMVGLWPHVGSHGSAVVSNGAITFDVRSREIIDISGIAASVGIPLCEAIRAELPGARFAIECVDGIRLDSGYVDPYPSPDVPRGTLAEIWTEPAVKLLVRHPDAPVDQFHERVSIVVGERATATWSVPGLVEISASGVTKASALRSLCDRMRVDARDVVAFGDMPNDIPMLEWAGTSYAMANAHPSVIDIADDLAPDCEEEGVAQVLERLVSDLEHGVTRG